jgi:YVTN family beta-propeller protein
VTTRLHAGRDLGEGVFPGGYLVAFGSVWVPEGQHGQVTRFPVAGGQSVVIKVGDPAKDQHGLDPGAVTLAGERVAVSSRAAHAVVLVDPTTDAVVTSVDVGIAPYGIAVEGDAVWATDYDNGVVVRSSVRTGKVVKRTSVSGPEGVVATGAAAFVATETGSLVRVDATTGASLAVPGVSGGNIETLASGGGSVWALDKVGGNVYRVDPTTNRLLAKVAVALSDPAAAGITFGAGTLWVVGGPAGPSVLGIRASTNKVAVRASLPVGVFSCAFGSSLLWTFSGESASDGDEVLGLDPRKLG